jgi:hypothetical protein
MVAATSRHLKDGRGASTELLSASKVFQFLLGQQTHLVSPHAAVLMKIWPETPKIARAICTILEKLVEGCEDCVPSGCRSGNQSRQVAVARIWRPPLLGPRKTSNFANFAPRARVLNSQFLEKSRNSWASGGRKRGSKTSKRGFESQNRAKRRPVPGGDQLGALSRTDIYIVPATTVRRSIFPPPASKKEA